MILIERYTPNTIVQMNGLQVINSVIVIEIFDVTVMYPIYSRVYTPRNYGIK